MRSAVRKRETKETSVEIELNLDGSGEYNCLLEPEMPFFRHRVIEMTKYANFDLVLGAGSKDNLKHHLAEDIAIVLGRAFKKALGDVKKTKRYAHARIPMEDALAVVAVDIGGRPYYQCRGFELENKRLEQETDHFLSSFAINGGICLHVLVEGKDDYYKVQAIYKALGAALKEAVEIR